jgi:hypothetical protein
MEEKVGRDILAALGVGLSPALGVGGLELVPCQGLSRRTGREPSDKGQEALAADRDLRSQDPA